MFSMSANTVSVPYQMGIGESHGELSDTFFCASRLTPPSWGLQLKLHNPGDDGSAMMRGLQAKGWSQGWSQETG